MSENLRPQDEDQPEEIPQIDPEQPAVEKLQEEEQTPEGILDVLESAFEKGAKAELTVSEPSGELRTNTVFIEGLEDGMLFVSSSKESPAMGIPIGDVKRAQAVEQETQEMSPEDFQEMLSQIPVLKEMLTERKAKLSQSADAEEIENLKTEIGELEQEIAFREEIEKESKE